MSPQEAELSVTQSRSVSIKDETALRGLPLRGGGHAVYLEKCLRVLVQPQSLMEVHPCCQLGQGSQAWAFSLNAALAGVSVQHSVFQTSGNRMNLTRAQPG